MAELPTHAYIPGRNERHPEDTFTALRESAVPGQGVTTLARSEAFRAGLQFFDAGYYWEAHEVLEPVWMALPDDTIERRFVQGLIQIANGRLKLRMGRLKAALRLVGQARGLIPAKTSHHIMTLDVQIVHGWIDALEREILLAL